MQITNVFFSIFFSITLITLRQSDSREFSVFCIVSAMVSSMSLVTWYKDNRVDNNSISIVIEMFNQRLKHTNSDIFRLFKY